MKADKKWVIKELALETAKASGWEKYYISKIEVIEE